MPPSAAYHVTGIGNAIVDVLAKVDDHFLERETIHKGTMTIVDAVRAESLYDKLGECVECSGGSVANSIAALASLGAKTAYIGRVADDALGKIFSHDMKSIGVRFVSKPASGGKPTARCLVCVTPDAQRSMSTYIGACAELTPEDIDIKLIQDSAVIYIEGYLWDQPAAKDAIRMAISAAKQAGRKVAFTLSDVFCVERHRPDFLALVENDIDVLFANEAEACSLFVANDLDDAVAKMSRRVETVVTTRSGDGAIVMAGGKRYAISAEHVSRVVDTTGAGDLFAAGFLYGFTQGWDIERSTRLAHRCAAEIIQQIGARAMKPLKRLVA